MRVLMLGWEFPPYISGGLGAACFGLTRALNTRGIDITFVLPRPVRAGHSEHLDVIGPVAETSPGAPRRNGVVTAQRTTAGQTTRVAVPGAITSPYAGAGAGVAATGVAAPPGSDVISFLDGGPGQADNYDLANGPDAAAAAYAAMCVDRLRGQRFDLIHAHDWPTFPAAIALAAITRVPWVAHIHSTEFDRSGERADPQIYALEQRGMRAADRVITVSAFTKAVCVERFGVHAAKIEVVYNGADARPRNIAPAQPASAGARPDQDDASDARGRASGGGTRTVLFLGRITAQKGPERFVAAAKKVLDVMTGVRFVMAGAGDMDRAVIEAAAAAGIGAHFSFTGFLRGEDVDRVFQMADVYVMPSVSEPFGIAPLEAINQDVPVIISRQSGVSEVLRHALKVDFWNTDDLADKIIAVLRHPPLGQALRDNAKVEVQDLTWDAAATRCLAVYVHARAAHHETV